MITKKKTFIKVRRGILEPKHIIALGSTWYLYLYILDQAEWDSGKINNWKDKFAADDLGRPLSQIRLHRQHLQDTGYINCVKSQHSQTIEVNNWHDPRKDNPKDYDESIEESQLSNIESGEDGALSNSRVEPELSESRVRVEPELSESFNGQAENLDSSSNKIQDIKIKDNKISYNLYPQPGEKFTEKQKIIREFISIVHVDFVNLDQPQLLFDLIEDYGKDPVMECAKWCAEKEMFTMSHVLSAMKTSLGRGWKHGPPGKSDERSEVFARMKEQAKQEQEAET